MLAAAVDAGLGENTKAVICGVRGGVWFCRLMANSKSRINGGLGAQLEIGSCVERSRRHLVSCVCKYSDPGSVLCRSCCHTSRDLRVKDPQRDRTPPRRCSAFCLFCEVGCQRH